MSLTGTQSKGLQKLAEVNRTSGSRNVMSLTEEQSKGLQKLAESMPAVFIFQYFKTLQRSRGYHTVEYLHSIASNGAFEHEREDLVPTYTDVLDLIKEFDVLELGTYVQGRKGHKTRIEWYEGTSLAQIGEAALPEFEAHVAELSLCLGKTKVKDGSVHLLPTGTVRGSDAPVMEHSYQLRPGVYLDFIVPQDLSQLEAQRLAAFVGTLSMES